MFSTVNILFTVAFLVVWAIVAVVIIWSIKRKMAMRYNQAQFEEFQRISKENKLRMLSGKANEKDNDENNGGN